ncbi:MULTISPECIES: hypothetical protein [unclassified Streptomyces]|uniref:hypothetical protein n=1 Tax=unclassified Streptomyces TaxID=2593676 RepID=UPI0037F6C3DC
MTTDISPEPPVPELWQALDEAARSCAPPTFSYERIMRRSRTIRRRRRWAAASLGAALLVPAGIEIAAHSGPTASHSVTSTDPRPTHSPTRHASPSPGPEVRIVRPGEKIQAGLGVWYLLKPREYCDATTTHGKPVCVGYLDVDQPGAVPMTMSVHPLAEGTVYILAYTGETPAARITMTIKGRTSELPIVRLAGRPAYVSTYAVGPARDITREQKTGLTSNRPVFRAYGGDGKEVAEMSSL